MIYALLFDGYRLVMTAYSQRAFLWKIRILKHPLKQYTKTDNEFWMFRAYETAADTINLTSISLEITVANIYEGITFDTAQP